MIIQTVRIHGLGVPYALSLQQHHLLGVWLVLHSHSGAMRMLHEVRGDEVVHLRRARRDGIAPECNLESQGEIDI